MHPRKGQRNLQESVIYVHMGSRNQTQAIRLDRKHPYLLSHLSTPQLYFYINLCNTC